MTNNIGVSSATSNFSSPVIKSFRVSQQRVRKGEPFQLEWKTEGADKVEIFRNGNLLTTVVPTVESIERKEFYDSDSDVVYQLLAHGGGSSARSEPVKVSLIREGVASKSNRWIGWVLGAVALLLIGWLVFTKFLGPRNENVAVAPVSAEEEPVRIVMLGHNTHGKSTLAAAIGKNLEKKSLIKPVTYGEISNPGTVEVQGVRVNAAILEWKDPRPFMLIDFENERECKRLLKSDKVSLQGAIVVVSAADGPMPQTREQLQMAFDKGIRSLIVFINKIDMVSDPELLELVEMEVKELISSIGFDLANVSVIKGSALMALNEVADIMGPAAVETLLLQLGGMYK